MRGLLIALLRAYRWAVSPRYGQVCKYHPTCSAYALTAVERFGALRGTGLALWRLLRCNPFSHGGYDPVPPLLRTTDNGSAPGSADPHGPARHADPADPVSTPLPVPTPVAANAAAAGEPHP